jgi:hypothetical protein
MLRKLHMLVFQMNVTSVCSKYFICFRRMLQAFWLDVAYVSHIYCKSMFQMFHLFQSYVAISVFSKLQMFYLDVTYVAVAIHVCCKCMFQMF